MITAWVHFSGDLPEMAPGWTGSMVPTSTLTTADGRQRQADQLRYSLENRHGPVSGMTIYVRPHPDDHMHTPRGKYKWLTAVKVF